jgi:hypothetical protein
LCSQEATEAEAEAKQSCSKKETKVEATKGVEARLLSQSRIYCKKI